MDTRRSISEIGRLSFQNNIVSPALEQSGGIWVLWMDGPITAHELEVSPRFIHLLVEHDPEAGPMEFTAVYMPPQPAEQAQVWLALHQLSSAVQHPWILLGDFNTILGPHEKQGGRPFYAARARSSRYVIL